MSNLIITEYLTTTNPSGVTNPPVCVYRFDSTASSLLDRTGQGRDLIIESGSEGYVDDFSSGLIGINLNSGSLVAPDDEVLRIAKDDGGGGDASLTIELIFKKGSGDTWDIIGCNGSGESLNTNFLYGVGGSNGSKFRTLSEYDIGNNIDISFTNADNITDSVIYIVMTVSADGQTRKIYVDGILLDTVSTTAAEKDISGNLQRLRFRTFNAHVYSARITDEVFGDADVQEVYDSLLGEPIPETHIDPDNSAYEDISSMINIGGEDKYGGFSYPDVRVGMRIDGYDDPGAFEDSSDFLNHSIKKDRYSKVYDTGYLVPSSNITGEKSEDNSDDRYNFLDECNFIEASGDKRHKFPHVNGGISFEPLKKSKDQVCSAEDRYSYIVGSVTDVNRSTIDIHGHFHLLSAVRPSVAFYYSTNNEAWSVPTQNSFSGYSKEGYKYTDGVQDFGPVEAPWRTEASSDYRSPDPSFPDEALVIAASEELIIYDLDNYDGTASSLVVWIRFMYDDMSNFKALGRGEFSIKAIKMVNGVLVVGTDHNGTENGGVFTIDFKATDQNVFSLVRSDNHYWADTGITISNRNDTGGVYTTTGVDPSLRIACEYIKSIDAVFDSSDVNKMWVVFSGEDISPEVLTFDSNQAQEHNPVTGDDLGDNNILTDGYRIIYIDDSGWLWFTRGRKIYRNIYDYQYGKLTQNSINRNIDRFIELPDDIKGLASARNDLFVLTTRGVYIVDRGSMEFWFAYSLPGSGSGGKENAPPKGEILVGEYPVFRQAVVFPTIISDFLVVSSYYRDAYGGGVTVIRTLDDKAVDSYIYPSLHEDGCFWGIVLPIEIV